MRDLEPGDRRQQQRRQKPERRHHQFARHRVATSLQTSDKLGELVIRRLRHLQQIASGFGRGIAARVALEQLGAQPRLERVHMPDHGRMVHAQFGRGTRHRAKPGDMIGGTDFVPGFDRHRAQATLNLFRRKLVTGRGERQGSTDARRDYADTAMRAHDMQKGAPDDATTVPQRARKPQSASRFSPQRGAFRLRRPDAHRGRAARIPGPRPCRSGCRRR